MPDDVRPPSPSLPSSTSRENGLQKMAEITYSNENQLTKLGKLLPTLI